MSSLPATISPVSGGPEVKFFQITSYSAPAYLPVRGRCLSRSLSSRMSRPAWMVLTVVSWVPTAMRMVSARAGVASRISRAASDLMELLSVNGIETGQRPQGCLLDLDVGVRGQRAQRTEGLPCARLGQRGGGRAPHVGHRVGQPVDEGAGGRAQAPETGAGLLAHLPGVVAQRPG